MALWTYTLYIYIFDRLEGFRGNKERKGIGEVVAWLRFFGGGRLWFMLFDSKLLIVIDMSWMILWSSLCTWLCDCVIWLCGLWLVWNPETLEFIFSNPIYQSDALNKEGLMKII